MIRVLLQSLHRFGEVRRFVDASHLRDAAMACGVTQWSGIALLNGATS